MLIQTEIGVNLSLTERAAARVKSLAVEADGSEPMLRLFVDGGGCSGFQYGFKLDAAVNDDDVSVETDGAKLVVDSKSLPFVNGSEVDFVDDLQGSQFVVNNPNAQNTCGCGTSFCV